MIPSNILWIAPHDLRVPMLVTHTSITIQDRRNPVAEPGYDCYLHVSHSPEPLNAAVHHALPKSWGGPDTLDNKVTLCPTGHENVHTVLNWFVSFGSPEAVPSYLSKHIGPSTMALAMRAWNQRPEHTPYT